MVYIDKRGVLEGPSESYPTIVELGCGNRKAIEDSLGVDLLDSPCVDIVGDAVDVLRMFPPGSLKEIHAYHFIEHVDDVDELLEVIARTLEPGGVFICVAPHFSNPYFYSDPTHKTFFGLYTFCYWTESTLFKRTTPAYKPVINLVLTSVDLIFRDSRPFYVNYAVKRVFGGLMNSTRGTREFYERWLTGFLSCYEVLYKVTKS